MTTIRLCHLYPAQMNFYADRGNIAVLARRLAWRGHQLEITESGPGHEPSADHELWYLGGGQDRDQTLVAGDLVDNKAPAMRAAADDGAAMLFVCGGIQLAGHSYIGVDGETLAGAGVLDLTTMAGPERLIGDLVIDAEIDGRTDTVVGYENHAGRTTLGVGCRPLGRVISGHGNDGTSGFEGAVRDRVIGTYLHGPLLPKNPWIADTLLGWAIEHRTGSTVELEPLPDELEAQARARAIARAGVER
ncbi:MAG: glutamine amidotransferase [Acidimicrobiia bacterium]|nr:glutamine amidotransferase [Acidimicrobiia bacterium]